MQFSIPERPGHGPALSVFWGDLAPAEPDDHPRSDWTVWRFWREWFLPRYLSTGRRHLCQRTIAEYRTAVRRFVELLGDLRLGEVTQAHLDQFVERSLTLGNRRGGRLSPRTVQKQCVCLDVFFTAAAPRTREARDTATEDGLFGLDRAGCPRCAPWFPEIELPEPEIQDRVFSLADLEALLAACRCARAPLLDECRPAAWWDALLRFVFNTGLRIGATLGLRRAMVHREPGLVWVDVPGRIGKRGRPKLLYLSSHAAAAIDSLPTRDRIFPWPHCTRHLYTILGELLSAASIPPERRYAFHALRASNATELFAQDPAAAQENLGHRSRATTIDHYVGKSGLVRAQANRIGTALEHIPQPRTLF